MYAAPDQALFGERIISGVLSSAISAGMVLALINLPGGAPIRQRVGAALVAFDLGTPAQDASADTAPPAPPAKPEPKLAAAPPERPDMPELGRIPPSQTEPEGEGTEPLPDAGETAATPSASEPGEAEAEPDVSVRPARSAGSGHPHKVAARTLPAKASPPSAGGQSGGYKSDVWRHLQHFRRPNVVGPGSAFVGFSVGDDGGVTELAIVRSSGSRRFDGEALKMVRRAQPFPKPPAQAGRRFVFEIRGS